MATVRDIINTALRRSGVTASGETPTANEVQDGLVTLNGMLDTWAASNLMVFLTKRELFDTVAGQATYTFGPTGDWVTQASYEISGISYILNSATVNPVELKLEELFTNQWQDQVVKNISSNLSSSFYQEHTFPNIEVTLFPVPSTNEKVAVYYRKSVNEFVTIDDPVALPNGWYEAMVYNLSARLTSEYGRELDAVTVAAADGAMTLIKRANIRPMYVKSDIQLRGMDGRTSFNNRYEA